MLHRYGVADIAHRVVGVGSVGRRAYLALHFGNGDDDPLFLQIKEATTPAHAPYLPPLSLRTEHDGYRVVNLQRILQSLGDPMLGHTTIDKRPYVLRAADEEHEGIDAGESHDGHAVQLLGVPVWGVAVARAHARSGDAARIAGYCGDGDTLDRALVDFAEAYGDQTERDHAELVKAIKAGHVKAVVEEGTGA
jgi:uncharacterized protein (DUF2252 family)